MKRMCAFFILFFIAFTVIGSEKVKLGSFVRKAMFIPLYEVSFYGPSSEEIAENIQNECTLNSLSDFSDHILSPKFGYNIKLSIRTIKNLKKYNMEFEKFISCLQRSGYNLKKESIERMCSSVDKNILKYADFLFGVDKGVKSSAFGRRESGDRFILEVKKGKGFVSYIPQKTKRNSEKLILEDPSLICDIISTYISPLHCSEELRDNMPEALLGTYLDSFY